MDPRIVQDSRSNRPERSVRLPAYQALRSYCRQSRKLRRAHAQSRLAWKLLGRFLPCDDVHPYVVGKMEA